MAVNFLVKFGVNFAKNLQILKTFRKNSPNLAIISPNFYKIYEILKIYEFAKFQKLKNSKKDHTCQNDPKFIFVRLRT